MTFQVLFPIVMAVLSAWFSASILVIWSAPLLFCAVFGFQLQRLKGKKMTAVYKYVSYCSMRDENDDPDFWFAGRWFIGYIDTKQTGQHGGEEKVMYILARKSQLNKITAVLEQKEKNIAEMELWYPTGDFFRPRWEKRATRLPTFEPRKEQQAVIDKILDIYRSKGHACGVLTGEPGVGKSKIPRLLVKKMIAEGLQPAYVKRFKPTTPNLSFDVMYDRIKPTEKKPLVVVMEEVDILIGKFHRNEIKPHEFLPIYVADKSDWNSFLDDIDEGDYQHLIIIMTSNRTIGWLNELDPSYLRKGRTDLRVDLKESKSD